MKKVGLQIDPIETLNFETDTSILLARELESRGFDIFYYTPKDLYIYSAEPYASGKYITFAGEKPYEFKSSSINLSLEECSIILLRQDPPFNMSYITTTHILELLPKTTCVINNPSGVRNLPEKLSVTNFPEFTPKTLITQSFEQLKSFFEEQKIIVLKALYGHGGNEVVKISSAAELENLGNIYISSHGYVVAQEFLPEVTKGDKRVFIVDGEVLGAFSRIPKSGSILANMAAGGSIAKTELTEKELEISEAVAQFLKAHDIFMAGIDLISEQLIEINITSPTGFKAFNKLYDQKIETKIIDELLKKAKCFT